MSKRPLSWHRECLSALKTSAARKRAELVRLEAHAADTEALVAELSRQIEVAEERGLDGFDRDRFLVPRRGPRQLEGNVGIAS